MQLSEFLQNRIDRARAVLYTISTTGWDIIREEQYDRLELQAFKALINLPIGQQMDTETYRLVLEHQMQAKKAELFRNMGKAYKDQLEQDMALLMQIQNGWEENSEVPETGLVPKQTLAEMLKSAAQRIKQDIAKHVNV